MQNTVNQYKQTRTTLLRSATSYLFRFGNYYGNGLVTQILLYSTISCFLAKLRIIVIQFISNELRFIRCVPLIIVFLIIFHVARHSFATLALSYGMSIESVSKMLGHNQIRTTQIYAKVTEEKIAKEMVAFKSRKKKH